MVHAGFIVIGLGLSLVSLTKADGKCLRPSVLIVSFDGFRHDFLSPENTPYLYELRSQGTYAEHMRNVFPTDTFPNHHSMATGVYPGVHGVFNNQIFDPKLEKNINSDSLWNQNKDVVPIWILNEESSDDCRSGTMMWPGGDEAYRNTTATFFAKLDDSTPWRERVDTLVRWFTNPTTPANLVMAYFQQPDAASHKYGPASHQVLEEIKNVDSISRYIKEQLDTHDLRNVNVFLLSDHGVDGVDKAHILNVGDKIENSSTVIKQSPIFYIWPKNTLDRTEEDDIYNTLKNESVENQHFSVYRKSEIPDKWHLRQNDRMPPILVVANEGYAFQDLLLSDRANSTDDNATWGVHGYDNSLSNMWPFFMCWGPLIKVGHRTLPFDNVDLFSLWTGMLLLTPPKTNGSLEYVKDILQEQSHTNHLLPNKQNFGVGLILIFFVASIILLMCLAKRTNQIKHSGYVSNFDPDRTPLEYNRLLEKTLV